MGISRKMVTGGILHFSMVGIAVSGCAGPAQQIQSAAGPSVSSSYDGRYAGTVKVTGGSVGMSARDCETPQGISIDVKNNQFSLAQPHPNVGESTPSLREKTTPVYNATIRSDGSIVGTSGNSTATMVGRISGTHMSGQINGLLCYYEFTADRV
jgi:hypothetical protein